MDERTAALVTSVREFLDEVVHAQREQQEEDNDQLSTVLATHLGTDPRRLPVVTEEVAAHLFVDLDLALEAIQTGDRPAGDGLAGEGLAGDGSAGDRSEGLLLGVGGGQQRRHNSLSEMLEQSRYGNFPIGAVDYRSIATGPDSARQAVSFGLRLFAFEGTPVAVLQRAPDPQFGRSAAGIEILTPVEGVAAGLISAVRKLMVERSVLRGQVLSLGGSVYEPGVGGITFHRRPVLQPDEIVLPAGVLERVRRHVAGVAEHRELLRAAGQHLKRGLLLYGPPGTGKTHTVRFLLGALPDLTVILLAGPAIQYVAEAAQMARALQPALVVLEDCDLVAESRDRHTGEQPLLFMVLEALDGLSDDADVAFLLTTNRVDVLEPALAQRPGRVDLAVEVPLPDQAARRRLLRLYTRALPFSAATLDAAAVRSAGITASFVKELVRRAVLIAAEAGHTPADDDLDAALDEMLSQRESITRSLLGTSGPA